MSILLTNDDGVDAPGLAALSQALAGLDTLYIAAPTHNNSGVGMAITIGRGLTAQRHAEWPGVAIRTSIDGTPADAVKYGLQHLLEKDPPRLVVSGINHGPNLGINVRCSGTIGAAFEAFIAGFPALAVSVAHTVPPFWDGAKHYVRVVAEKALLLAETRRDLLLNLNVPALPPEKIKGLRLAHHGIGGYRDLLVTNGAPGSFSMNGNWISPEASALACDAATFEQGYAVLTPLRFDMTDRDLLSTLTHEWGDVVARAGTQPN